MVRSPRRSPPAASAASCVSSAPRRPARARVQRRPSAAPRTHHIGQHGVAQPKPVRRRAIGPWCRLPVHLQSRVTGQPTIADAVRAAGFSANSPRPCSYRQADFWGRAPPLRFTPERRGGCCVTRRQVQVVPLRVNEIGEVSFDVQVPWKPNEVLPPSDRAVVEHWSRDRLRSGQRSSFQELVIFWSPEQVNFTRGRCRRRSACTRTCACTGTRARAGAWHCAARRGAGRIAVDDARPVRADVHAAVAARVAANRRDRVQRRPICAAAPLRRSASIAMALRESKSKQGSDNFVEALACTPHASQARPEGRVATPSPPGTFARRASRAAAPPAPKHTRNARGHDHVSPGRRFSLSRAQPWWLSLWRASSRPPA